MNWNQAIDSFAMYLKIEKSLSDNTVQSYCRDIHKLACFCLESGHEIFPDKVKYENLRDFVLRLNQSVLSRRTQARIISGIKSFFRYLLLNDTITEDPSALLESPRPGVYLPEVLSPAEIDKLIKTIDLSRSDGHRNKAMLETLYSCGLRVSELTNLRLTDLFFEEGYIRIIGKGNKERLIPISQHAIEQINIYVKEYRNKMPKIDKKSENILFLNRRGRKLTRVMIFTIIKELAKKAGMKKNVSPHTFRHSFATHLYDNGANLRAIQQMLGHESIITTEIYTHLSDSYLRDTILTFHPRYREKKSE